MRLIILFFLLITSLYAKSDIDKKISKTNVRLNSYHKNYSNINKKMANNAKEILKQKRELVKQNKFLKALKKELSIKELSYKENTSQLKLMKKSQSKLSETQERIEEELTFVIAKSVSLSVVLDEDYSADDESLIEFEVLKTMLKASKEKAKVLGKQFSTNAKDIDFLNQHASSLEVAISNIDTKRKKLLKTQEANKKALKKLTLAKSSYKKELKSLLKRQNALKKTLSKLNIVKIDNIKKAKEEKARKAAFEKQKIVLDEKLPTVKKHGNSYQAVKTKKYRGKKTISPIDSYTIIYIFKAKN